MWHSIGKRCKKHSAISAYARGNPRVAASEGTASTQKVFMIILPAPLHGSSRAVFWEREQSQMRLSPDHGYTLTNPSTSLVWDPASSSLKNPDSLSGTAVLVCASSESSSDVSEAASC